jgi:hypothetical protein
MSSASLVTWTPRPGGSWEATWAGVTDELIKGGYRGSRLAE